MRLGSENVLSPWGIWSLLRERQVVEQLGRVRFSSDRLNLSICYSGLQWRNIRFHLQRSETTFTWDPMAGMQCVNKSIIEAGEKVRDTVWRSDLTLKTTRCVHFFCRKTQHNHIHTLLQRTGGNVQPQCPNSTPSPPTQGSAWKMNEWSHYRENFENLLIPSVLLLAVVTTRPNR